METARFCSQHCKGIWRDKNGLLLELPIMTGANHSQWTGGSEVYCEKLSLEFRHRIRAFLIMNAQNVALNKVRNYCIVTTYTMTKKRAAA